MAYDVNKLTKLSALKSLAERLNTEASAAFRSAKVDGNTVSFFTSKDKSGTAAFSFDFPVEMFLDQTKTVFVESFSFSESTYPGATNPNLNGSPVMVLAVKSSDDSISYSFLNMSALVDTYSAADGETAIEINGYKLTVKVSANTGNLLSKKSDGLYIGADSSKADKVTGATSGNIASLDANGNLSDSGSAIATDTEVSEMLTEVFGS